MVVDPSDTWVMGRLRDRDLLTLQSCTPIPSFDERLIVRPSESSISLHIPQPTPLPQKLPIRVLPRGGKSAAVGTQGRSSGDGGAGGGYRRRATTVIKPRDKWVAVPVLDAGISCEWVDAARDAVKDNRVPSSAGHRFWELSGGIFCCGGCSRRMLTNTVNPVRGHHYYRCPTRLHDGKDACIVSKNFRADNVEPRFGTSCPACLRNPSAFGRALRR